MKIYTIPLWKKIIREIVDIVVPLFCLNCGQHGEIICSDCLSLIDINDKIYCPYCQVPRFVGQNNQGDGRCPRHRNKSLQGVLCSSSYEDRFLRNIIKKYKYAPFYEELKYPLAKLLMAHFALVEPRILKSPSLLIVPVPLYKSKKNWRGYNQAEKITQILSLRMNIPFSLALKREKNTAPQPGLGKKEREENIKKAFAVKEKEEIKGRDILLIDDVFTSGATMIECAKTLKKAGCHAIWGATVARE